SVPALVIDSVFDILAWNSLAVAFLTDFAALPARERNAVRMVYLDDDVRSRFSDWPTAARTAASLLRLSAATDPQHDARLAEIVDELTERDADFRRWWASQGVVSTSGGVRTYVHPAVGEFQLEWQTLTSIVHANQRIFVITPVDTVSKNALRNLARA